MGRLPLPLRTELRIPFPFCSSWPSPSPSRIPEGRNTNSASQTCLHLQTGLTLLRAEFPTLPFPRQRFFAELALLTVHVQDETRTSVMWVRVAVPPLPRPRLLWRRPGLGWGRRGHSLPHPSIRCRLSCWLFLSLCTTNGRRSFLLWNAHLNLYSAFSTEGEMRLNTQILTEPELLRWPRSCKPHPFHTTLSEVRPLCIQVRGEEGPCQNWEWNWIFLKSRILLEKTARPQCSLWLCNRSDPSCMSQTACWCFRKWSTDPYML